MIWPWLSLATGEPTHMAVNARAAFCNFSAAGFSLGSRNCFGGFKLEKRRNWEVEREGIGRDAEAALSHRTRARMRPRDLLLKGHQDDLSDS